MDQKLKSFDEISECLIEVMHELYASVEDEDFHKNEDGPTVILMVGVNGSGKTTTTAKLTKLFQSEGSSVDLRQRIPSVPARSTSWQNGRTVWV